MPNGKIYLAPCDAPKVLCIDPEAQLVEEVGAELQGVAKYTAVGVLVPNCKIYFAY